MDAKKRKTQQKINTFFASNPHVPTSNTDNGYQYTPSQHQPSDLVRQQFLNPTKQKKLVFNGFTKRPVVAVERIEAAWTTLDAAIKNILLKSACPQGYEIVYRTCEMLCRHGKASDLYMHLSSRLKSHVESLHVSITSHTHSVIDTWTTYIHNIGMIRNAFLYLERTYIMQQTDKRTLMDVGIHLFQEIIPQDKSLTTQVCKDMMEMIERSRNNSSIDVLLLKNHVQMFGSLMCYFSVFEVFFIQNTLEYYTLQSTTRTLVSSGIEPLELCSTYMQWITKSLDKETWLCSEEGCLFSSSREKSIQIIHDVCISKKVSFMLHTGFFQMLDANVHDSLHTLFNLFQKVDALVPLKARFVEYIIEYGSMTLLSVENDSTMVHQLLVYKAKLDTIVQTSFSNSPMFQNAIKEGFESFMAKRKEAPAEMIAKHIDAIMKQTHTEKTNDTLIACIHLFRYIQAKDMFLSHYKSLLAKRLLLDKSSSIDVERGILQKLKEECGAEYTQGLECMLSDMETSKSIFRAFKDSRWRVGADFGVCVLTQANWPTYPSLTVNIPQHIVDCQVAYETFYRGIHKGRTLMWTHAISTCVLKAYFENGNKELIVSTLQAVVLLLFNKRGTLSAEEIMRQSGIEEEECFRTLQSLSVGKYKVLLKKSKGKNVSKQDTFQMNNAFTSSLNRIKINTIQQQQTPQEIKALESSVYESRPHVIDAAIMRIMKSKKRARNNELFNELFAAVKEFGVTGDQMKKRVETLIEREYLERDAAERDVYVYMA